MIDASFCKLFLSSVRERRLVPLFLSPFASTICRQWNSLPPTRFLPHPKKLSWVSMLELLHPACVYDGGAVMTPNPLQQLHPFKTPFNPTPSQPGCDIGQRWSIAPPIMGLLALDTRVSWKLMLRELKAVCFYLSVLFQRDSALKLTRGYTTIITQCQILSHAALPLRGQTIIDSTQIIS